MKKSLSIVASAAFLLVLACLQSGSARELRVSAIVRPASAASSPIYPYTPAGSALYNPQKGMPFTPDSLTPLFPVPDDGNMQGLAFANGKFYIGFDRGNGMGQIVAVTPDGQRDRETGYLGIEHTAELAYRDADRCMYVSNGQPNATVRIYAVDIESPNPRIVRTLKPNITGYGALVAVDNKQDVMIVSTNSAVLPLITKQPQANPSKVNFYLCDFNGGIRRQFTIPYQGIPQGIESYGGKIYFYTNNKITVISGDGKIEKTLYFSIHGESEGMTLANLNGKPVLAVGYNSPNRLYAYQLP